ncbi:MAG: 4-hydroxy-3-methylbut-2-enyl diphosphate reductase [Candidatus Omnitrophica bacterium]|nr:4-hydroxy-3-methylbut-2-enyl diphosphate reductase [Candidatus Omnitrophota bacterium]
MKIEVAKSAGFCIGVKKALEIAKNSAKSNQQIYMLGDIVHNEEVIKDMQKIGIKKINRLASGKNKTILIRAHGAPKSIHKSAKKYGYKIIDATCPMVKEIHKIAQNQEKKGYTIIVIGDKNHDEVKGIVGQLNKQAIVISPNLPIKSKQFKNIDKAAIVTQSTQNIEKVKKIVDKINKYIPDLKFINTICGPTQQKQNEIKNIAKNNEIVLIIGSKMSANTKRLYQISKNINFRTYWIENKNNIQLSWLEGINSVGIAAGASTPENIINSTVEKIKKISKAN